MLRSRCSITAMSGPMKQEWSTGCHSRKVGFLDLLHERNSQKTNGFFSNCCMKITQQRVVFWPAWISRKQKFFWNTARKSKKNVFFTWWLTFPENKGFFELLHENPRKPSVLTWSLNFPENKVFFELLHENPRKTSGFFAWWLKFQENKGFFCCAAWNQKNNGAPNPAIYITFSALEPQLLECYSVFSAAETTSRNQPHYQRYFQGTDAHESKPSEEGRLSGHGLLALES